MRLAAAFIVVCMALIAASIGAVLYLTAWLTGSEAALVGLAVLAALAGYNAASGRIHDREDVSAQIADLSRGVADLARQVGDFGRRLAEIESPVSGTQKGRASADPLASEIDELGTLVKQLAESVAAHEKALASVITRSGMLSGASTNGLESAAAIDPAELGATELERTGSERAALDREQMVAQIREAIESNRVELYLQPIVSLPQRKVRYYEAVSRLRAKDGELWPPAEFLSLAEGAGLLPRIDNLLLFRCVQVVRQLSAKKREIGLFCNISRSTLVDGEYFPQLSEFMQANRAIAPLLILEFAHATVREMGPLEFESLTALSELGFRFSLDQLQDLKLEPRELAERGFRFVKAPATLLLNRVRASESDIHPADFSDLLGRFGIDLIAEKIESEGVVVDLLDYDVRFGQGFLFSPPRPVRPELLFGVGDRIVDVTLAADQPQVFATDEVGGAATPEAAVKTSEPRKNTRAKDQTELADDEVRRA